MQQSRRIVWLTLLAGLLLAILPLPEALQGLRPPLVTMAVIYWSMMWPRSCGVFTAWVAGLALDILLGNVFGQHALALSVVAYLVQRFHLQIRIFPLWQLTMTAFALLAIDEFIVFWIDGIVDAPLGGLGRWTRVVAGGVLWPVVMALCDRLRQRAENRNKAFA